MTVYVFNEGSLYHVGYNDSTDEVTFFSSGSNSYRMYIESILYYIHRYGTNRYCLNGTSLPDNLNILMDSTFKDPHPPIDNEDLWKTLIDEVTNTSCIIYHSAEECNAIRDALGDRMINPDIQLPDAFVKDRLDNRLASALIGIVFPV